MVRGRLAFALVLLLAPALGATAFLLPSLQPQQQPRQQAPRRLAAASSPSSSSTSSNGMAVVAKALARALAAPALLVTAMLAPSPIMLDGSGSAAWAISGGGKDWVRGVCGDLTAAVCLGRMPSQSTHPTNPPQMNNRQRPGSRTRISPGRTSPRRISPGPSRRRPTSRAPSSSARASTR